MLLVSLLLSAYYDSPCSDSRILKLPKVSSWDVSRISDALKACSLAVSFFGIWGSIMMHPVVYSNRQSSSQRRYAGCLLVPA